MAYYGNGVRLDAGGGGGRGGSIGEYQGQFDATTVKQRAFDANDYIVFDDGTDLLVFLAPVDIPINSPAPKANGSLWGELDTTVTSGISRGDLNSALGAYVPRATFNTALATKADSGDLLDYLRTSTYNLDKAQIESGITGNDNDIAQLMTTLSALQTTVNNLPKGGGSSGGTVSGVTMAALDSAIDDLRTALQASIDAKQDAATAATDAELTTAVSTLRMALQSSIDILTTQVSNIPLSTELLWATSKVLVDTSNGLTLDTDWVASDAFPAGAAISGDSITIPGSFRGEIHIDVVTGAGTESENIVGKVAFPLAAGNTNFIGDTQSQKLQARVTYSGDPLVYTLTVRVRTAVFRPSSNTVLRFYGISALPRSQVAAVTEAELSAAVKVVDDKFGGIPLNGPEAGGFLNNINIQNLNEYIPETNIVTVPVFSWVDLRRDPSSLGPSVGDLGQYDRILIRITFYTGSLASARRTESFDFFVNIAEWDSLKTVPFPTQALADSETDRVSIIASIKDNRALVHEFPQLAPSDVSAADTLRANQRLLYVGKSSETNPQLLLAISGTTDDFLAEVKGYY